MALATPDARATPPCASARTINYGRTGEFEYTQAGLAPLTKYDFQVTACDEGNSCGLDANGNALEGSGWRQWSESFEVNTTDSVGATAVTEDSACEDGGQVLTALEGTISRSLGQARDTARCRTKPLVRLMHADPLTSRVSFIVSFCAYQARPSRFLRLILRAPPPTTRAHSRRAPGDLHVHVPLEDQPGGPAGRRRGLSPF